MKVAEAYDSAPIIPKRFSVDPLKQVINYKYFVDNHYDLVQECVEFFYTDEEKEELERQRLIDDKASFKAYCLRTRKEFYKQFELAALKEKTSPGYVPSETKKRLEDSYRNFEWFLRFRGVI